MKYEYKVIYIITGGFTLIPEMESTELYLSKNLEVLLLKTANEFCKEIDLNTALGRLFLRRLFLDPKDRLSSEIINQEIESIRKIRQEKAQKSNFVAIKISGEHDINMNTIVYQDDKVILNVGENDNSEVIDKHQKEINIALSAIKLNSKTTLQYDKVGECIYFQEKGKIIIRKAVSFPHPKVFCANGITQFDVQNIKNYIDTISSHDDLEKILRFHNHMHERKNDELKAFIYGWTGLEIFVNKNFGKYYDIFLENLNSGDEIYLKFSERLESIIKDRIRLNDKFLVIASCLNHNPDMLKDLELFDIAKKSRDKYFHGEDISDFPIDIIDCLLNKYLNLHILKN